MEKFLKTLYAFNFVHINTKLAIGKDVLFIYMCVCIIIIIYKYANPSMQSRKLKRPREVGFWS